MRLPRVRFTVGRMMIAVAIAGAVCAGVRALLPESPQVLALRQRAREHQGQARVWAHYAKISEEGVTTLQRGWLIDGRPGEILQFNHFVPRRRPVDPDGAKAFDRECAAVAAKCRVMQGYHEQLGRKWEDAADNPSKVVTLDPPPPLPIEPSTVQDITD